MPVDAYIVDTSVLVRWFLGQAGWQTARKYRDDFLDGTLSLQTVECARFELPWALRKKGLIPGQLTIEEYIAAVRVIDDWSIHVEPFDVDDIEQSAVLSAEHNMTFFDATFVFRALVTGVPLLTADARLAHAAEGLVEVRLISDT